MVVMQESPAVQQDDPQTFAESQHSTPSRQTSDAEQHTEPQTPVAVGQHLSPVSQLPVGQQFRLLGHIRSP